jgi:hypothetical protein
MYSFMQESLLLLERVGEVLVLQVDSVVSQGWRQEYDYRNTRWMSKLKGTEELSYGAYWVQLRLLF